MEIDKLRSVLEARIERAQRDSNYRPEAYDTVNEAIFRDTVLDILAEMQAEIIRLGRYI